MIKILDQGLHLEAPTKTHIHEHDKNLMSFQYSQGSSTYLCARDGGDDENHEENGLHSVNSNVEQDDRNLFGSH